jgi:hypothetical protein
MTIAVGAGRLVAAAGRAGVLAAARLLVRAVSAGRVAGWGQGVLGWFVAGVGMLWAMACSMAESW